MPHHECSGLVAHGRVGRAAAQQQHPKQKQAVCADAWGNRAHGSFAAVDVGAQQSCNSYREDFQTSAYQALVVTERIWATSMARLLEDSQIGPLFLENLFRKPLGRGISKALRAPEFRFSQRQRLKKGSSIRDEYRLKPHAQPDIR